MSAPFTAVPNAVIDDLLADLTGGETKVYLYLSRRTRGFQRESDAVSITQLCNGIKKRDGTVLDRGTGMCRQAVIDALRGLEAKRLLRRSAASGTTPDSFTLIDPEGSENLTATGKESLPLSGLEILPLSGKKSRPTKERGKSSSKERERKKSARDTSASGAAPKQNPKPLSDSLRVDDEEPKTTDAPEVYATPEAELRGVYYRKTGSQISPDVERRVWETAEVGGFSRTRFIEELRPHVPNTWKNPAGFLTNFARKIGSTATPEGAPPAPEPPEPPEPPKGAHGRCGVCGGVGTLADGNYCTCHMGRDLAALAARQAAKQKTEVPTEGKAA